MTKIRSKRLASIFSLVMITFFLHEAAWAKSMPVIRDKEKGLLIDMRDGKDKEIDDLNYYWVKTMNLSEFVERPVVDIEGKSFVTMEATLDEAKQIPETDRCLITEIASSGAKLQALKRVLYVATDKKPMWTIFFIKKNNDVYAFNPIEKVFTFETSVTYDPNDNDYSYSMDYSAPTESGNVSNYILFADSSTKNFLDNFLLFGLLSNPNTNIMGDAVFQLSETIGGNSIDLETLQFDVSYPDSPYPNIFGSEEEIEQGWNSRHDVFKTQNSQTTFGNTAYRYARSLKVGSMILKERDILHSIFLKCSIQ